MVAIISLLVILILSMTVVRVATVALTLTGLSKELARFQARSAFSGTGFTTSESERVIQHPVRRRIIMMLMLVGNAGIITAMGSLILTFVNVREAENPTATFWLRMIIIVAALTVLWTVASSRWLDRWMTYWIAKALKRWTTLEARDYAGLLHLTGDYVVVELQVQQDDWMTERTLDKLNLMDEGILVLGIEKPDGNYLGAPRGSTKLEVNDRVVLYGHQDTIANLDERRAGHSGNWEHVKAVEQHHRVRAAEEEIVEET